ncbi:uncharacterized isoform X3 [Zea mays]|uniref:uncharacterized isoform X3 n=1 Tax=Zea mays TaxID=4577 RepID=UPI0009A98254|nr:uncharacterized protein LOC100382848 isoform X3 [Zea mays]|eukprot:XP_020409090.1 uncharacterized protein LOC100382848 isoform X3 [Zea mays]
MTKMQISQENQAGELSSAKPSKTLWCAGPIKGPTNRSGGSRADIHLQARDSAAIWAKTQARGDAAPSRLRRHGTGIGARARQVPPLQEILLRSLRRRYRRFRFLLFVHPGRPRRRAQRDPTCALNMERLLEARISSAVGLRHSLGLPSADTNAYRLINSEGDRLSGLIVDIFADVAVIASSAAWVEKYRQEIQFLVSKVNGVSHIKWRPSTDILKEEGLDISEHKEPASTCSTVKVMENGIVYLVSLEGQKTGFYADQRENRYIISLLSKDQRVLDLCCYSGGFALNAAKGGADNVIGIDSSGSALDLANENIVLNELNQGKVSFVKGDATTFMKGAISENELWDLVILDPPKLAPRKKVLQSASGMYRSLNALAMQVVKPGGLLMTCSCSGAMTQSGMFLKTIQGAASMAGRKVTVLRQAGAACDHPIDPAYPEGQYLSNYLLRVA